MPAAPLDPAFVADCPYGPGGLLIDQILFIRCVIPVTCRAGSCIASKIRRMPKRVFARYAFRFTQRDTLVYEGEQNALYTKVAE